MAARDSLGFFQDWPDELWKIQKQISLARKHEHPRIAKPRNDKPEPSTHWYQKNWDPDFSCPAEDKIGNMGDGHKWVCDPHRIASQKDCLIYSVGSNGKFDFEEGIQQRLPFCEIHVFDFTDYSGRVPKGLNVTYHSWGLKPSYSSNNIPGTPLWVSKNTLEWKSFPEIVDILGHSDRLIEIFKIDCEGCEWHTYKDWLNFNIRQILVETHRTPPMVNDFFSDIHATNFVMFHKEANILGTGGRAIEFSFLKMNGSFFQDEE
jgi:Methyltransferase domain